MAKILTKKLKKLLAAASNGELEHNDSMDGGPKDDNDVIVTDILHVTFLPNTFSMFGTNLVPTMLYVFLEFH
jgi:hypothetical protein